MFSRCYFVLWCVLLFFPLWCVLIVFIVFFLVFFVLWCVLVFFLVFFVLWCVLVFFMVFFLVFFLEGFITQLTRAPIPGLILSIFTELFQWFANFTFGTSLHKSILIPMRLDITTMRFEPFLW